MYTKNSKKNFQGDRPLRPNFTAFCCSKSPFLGFRETTLLPFKTTHVAKKATISTFSKSRQLGLSEKYICSGAHINTWSARDDAKNLQESPRLDIGSS